MNNSYNYKTNTLSVNVTNIKKFKELIQLAQKQADELQNTINQLEYFDLDIKFSIDEKD